MRLILITSIVFFIVSCKPNNNTLGVWISSDFGILKVHQDSIFYFGAHTIKPEIWKKENSIDKFKYEGYRYYNCAKETNVSVSIHNDDKNRLILDSDSSCFPDHPVTDHIILNRMPSSLNIDFDKLVTRVLVNGKWKEQSFSLANIIDIQTDDSLFSIEEQIWLLFSSGIDFHTEGHTPLYKIELQLRSSNFQFSKTVTTYPNPIYLRPLMDYLLVDLI